MSLYQPNTLIPDTTLTVTSNARPPWIPADYFFPQQTLSAARQTASQRRRDGEIKIQKQEYGKREVGASLPGSLTAWDVQSFAPSLFYLGASGSCQGDVSLTRGDAMWRAIAAGGGAFVTASAGSPISVLQISNSVGPPFKTGRAWFARLKPEGRASPLHTSLRCHIRWTPKPSDVTVAIYREVHEGTAASEEWHCF